MMVEGLRDPSKLAFWLERGGDTALASYGGDPAAVPQAHIAWLDQLRLMHVDAHRLYVHAGVDPGMRWIGRAKKRCCGNATRKDDSSGFGERHVVHGHDNDPEGPLLFEGRTNLDTAAWKTGRLTVGVFDDDRPGGPSISSWSREQLVASRALGRSWGGQFGMIGVSVTCDCRPRRCGPS